MQEWHNVLITIYSVDWHPSVASSAPTGIILD